MILAIILKRMTAQCAWQTFALMQRLCEKILQTVFLMPCQICLMICRQGLFIALTTTLKHIQTLALILSTTRQITTTLIWSFKYRQRMMIQRDHLHGRVTIFFVLGNSLGEPLDFVCISIQHRKASAQRSAH